jgi:acyl transferase domain-containing protein
MLAVNMGASSAQVIIDSDERFASLSISCDNGPGDCVVGGPIASLQSFKEHLTDNRGTKSKFLDVPMAYHTEAMDPILDELTRYAGTLQLRKPTLTVISNVLGRAIPVGDGDIVFTPDYFARHARQTVAFQQGLDDFLSSFSESPRTHWIEVGPHASLLPMIASQAPQAKPRLVPCMRKGVLPSLTLSQLLGHFYLKSSSINWRQAFAFQQPPRLVDLPGLPFQRSEFVVAYPHEWAKEQQKLESVSAVPSNIFLGRTIQLASESKQLSSIYETSIQFLKNLITGHIVCSHALCPASVYHQMALSAVRATEPHPETDVSWSLTNVSYVAPLLYTPESTSLIRTRISPNGLGGYDFAISSYAPGTDPDRRGVSHCHGQLKRKAKKSTVDKHVRVARILERQVQRLLQPEPSAFLETFSTKAMYNHVFTRVVTYSELYQQVQSIRISPDYCEAYARCRVDKVPRTQEETNSIFMDVLLHVAGFVANLSVNSDEVGICKQVASALVLREPSKPGSSFNVYCSLVTLQDNSAIIADAQAADKDGVMAVFKGMVFHRAKLAGISRVFGMQSKKAQESSSSTLPIRSVASLAVPKLTPPSLQRMAASPHGIALPPQDATNTITRRLIAEACGLSVAALPAGNVSLKELGFDSLLQIELESQLQSAFPHADLSGLADCETVGDIENLSSGQQTSGQQTLETTPSLVSGTPSIEDTSDEELPDVQQLTRAIIAETCSGDMNSITSSSELVALGIDSLMVFELESSLAKISRGGTVSTAELAQCLTVGDVEKLVGAFYSN